MRHSQPAGVPRNAARRTWCAGGCRDETTDPEHPPAPLSTAPGCPSCCSGGCGLGERQSRRGISRRWRRASRPADARKSRGRLGGTRVPRELWRELSRCRARPYCWRRRWPCVSRGQAGMEQVRAGAHSARGHTVVYERGGELPGRIDVLQALRISDGQRCLLANRSLTVLAPAR